SLGTALSRPKEDMPGERSLKVFYKGRERLGCAGVAFLAKLGLECCSREPFRLRSVLGARNQCERIRRFYYFFQTEPRVGFNAMVEKVPVDLLDAFRPPFIALSVHRAQHLLGEGFSRDSKRLRNLAQQTLPRRLLEREGRDGILQSTVCLKPP